MLEKITDDFIVKDGKKLKLGYTTGSCAAAASKAAATMLLSGEKIETVTIHLPAGKSLSLPVLDVKIEKDSVSCAIVKDGGDDPDVTTGMRIYAAVKRTDAGITIDGGEGVGRVTKPGLACKVGEAAINPVPRSMIESSLTEAAEQNGYSGGLEAIISAPQGAEIAKKTFNERLGILGGISILGTTGIVEPMSEKALVDTIKLEISVKKRDRILFISPGNYGLDFSKNKLGIDIDNAVKCSNFMGETLDYAAFCGFSRILLVGHVGKLVKLAAGIMNTHSSVADGRNEIFASHAALCGANKEVIHALMAAHTTDEMHDIVAAAGIAEQVYKSIAQKIAFHLKYRLKDKARIEFLVFSNENGILIQSEAAINYIDEVKGYSL